MATEAIVQRTPRGIVAASMADVEAMDGMTYGVDYRAVFTRMGRRSVRQNRLLFGLIKIIRENYPEPLTAHAIKETLKLLTGHVNVVQLQTGQVVMTPKSISFEKMDQDAFNAWFPRAVDAMCREFVPGLTVEAAQREIEKIAFDSGKGAGASKTPVAA
jgi:hypothetical protein